MVSKSIWEIIEKSKSGKEYLSSDEQYLKLIDILSTYDKDDVRQMYIEWSNNTEIVIRNEEFDKLHASKGGIVYSGDDGFYMDFGSWVIAQGKELFDDFQLNGATAILDYILKYDVSNEDFMFECMSYAFHDFID